MLAGSRLACLDEARPKAERSLAGRQGFEPRFHGPEPCVLPLDDLPARRGKISLAESARNGQTAKARATLARRASASPRSRAALHLPAVRPLLPPGLGHRAHPRRGEDVPAREGRALLPRARGLARGGGDGSLRPAAG